MSTPRIVLLAAAGAEWERPVEAALEAERGIVVLKRCMDVEDLLACAAAGQADAALVALDAPGLDVAAVERLRAFGLDVVAVAPAHVAGEALTHRAQRIGIDAVVVESALDDVVPRLLAVPDQTASPQHDDRPAGPDQVFAMPPAPSRGNAASIAVWGPAGAPGRTTVAAGLAVALGARSKAALLDVDPFGGAVAQHLGVLDEVSGLLASTRLAAAGTLDVGLAGLMRSLGGGVSVLTGLPRADRWTEVRPGLVEQLIEVLTIHSHVVLDTGFCLEDDVVAEAAGRVPRHQLTIESLRAADEIVVVGQPDPIGLTRLARGLVDLGELTGGRPVHLVLNRMRGTLGWTEREVLGMVQGFASLASVHVLPEDRTSADRALVAGRSVAELGDSPISRGLAELAEALLGPAAPTPRLALRTRKAGRARRR